jgi:hypothetical protein
MHHEPMHPRRKDCNWRRRKKDHMEAVQQKNPPMICVADVDTRLACSAICVACPLFMPDRRQQERRAIPRRTRDRRVMNRHF